MDRSTFATNPKISKSILHALKPRTYWSSFIAGITVGKKWLPVIYSLGTTFD